MPRLAKSCFLAEGFLCAGSCPVIASSLVGTVQHPSDDAMTDFCVGMAVFGQHHKVAASYAVVDEAKLPSLRVTLRKELQWSRDGSNVSKRGLSGSSLGSDQSKDFSKSASSCPLMTLK